MPNIAIRAFLVLMEKSIGSGKNIGSLPEVLAKAMLDNLHHDIDLSGEIAGEVDL
ncbi:MAG: hypothetical protein HKL98_04505 [Burkholderiales bacterium]|nr:hypothetical protein [Burkholderiales bacterium]